MIHSFSISRSHNLYVVDIQLGDLSVMFWRTPLAIRCGWSRLSVTWGGFRFWGGLT
jgi:hypothetical protein